MIFKKTKTWRLKFVATVILCLLFILGITQTNVINKEKKENTDNEVTEGEPLNVDPFTELKMIAERYEGNLSLSGNVKLFDYQTSEFLEEQKFSYSRYNGNVQSSLGDIETISNADYAVSIDNIDKIVLVSGADKNLSRILGIEKFKMLLSEDGASAKVYSTKSQRILVVQNINMEDIVNYKIYYDSASYKINKVVLEMSTVLDLTDQSEEKPVMEIPDVQDNIQPGEIDTTSNDIDMLPVKSDYLLEVIYNSESNHPAAVDPVEKIIAIKNQIIYLSDAFKDYQLVDQVKKYPL